MENQTENSQFEEDIILSDRKNSPFAISPQKPKVRNKPQVDKVSKADKVTENKEKKSSVKIVAFYGKKDCEELQDFLLQMTYIERLKKYREKDVTIDTTQYYTASKCFLESDNINVSNSVRCNFRYNM